MLIINYIYIYYFNVIKKIVIHIFMDFHVLGLKILC